MRVVSTPEQLAPRVEKLEIEVGKLTTGMAGLVDDVGEVKNGMGSMAGKVDQLVAALSSTDGRAAERTEAMKGEIRQENERKARDRKDMFQQGLALIGTVVLVVGAIGGPYLNKINATSDGQADDTRAIGSVREVLAQVSAETTRNHDSLDIQRENNRIRDDRLWDLNTRVSRIEGGRLAR